MSVITDIVERLRTLLFRRQEERELEEELRFHVSMEAELHQKLGVTESEAHRRSVIALGGIEQTKEHVRDARGTRLLEDTGGDFRQALKNLRKSPGFAMVAILTLSIGIGATTAVYSAVHAVLLQPLPYAEPGQLVRLYQYYLPSGSNTYVTPVHFLAYQQQLGSLEAMAALENYNPVNADIGGRDHPERIRLLPVSADYFSVLGVQPAMGRAFERSEENSARVVILSHERWLREFNGEPALGKTLIMSGHAFTLVGVMPPRFTDPLEGIIDAWVPFDARPGRDASNAGNHYLTVIGRLRSTATISRAQLELDKLGAVLGTQYSESARDTRARLTELKEDIVGASSRSLLLMFGAVVLVLLLVCVNIANLLLVRSSERAREFAVRSALGAHRARLLRQLLVESLTLAFLGAAGGLIIARLSMTAIVTLGAGAIPRLNALSVNPGLLAFATSIAVACSVVFGLAPALRATQTQPSEVLRQQTRSSTGSKRQGRWRESLVVSQVALAFVMLVGASLLLASFRQIQQVPLGVQPERVLAFELALPSARYDSTARARAYEELAANVMKLPGVVAAGGVSRLPATGEYNVWGTRPLTGPVASRWREMNLVTPQQRVVSGQYFRAMGIRVLQGRVFDASDDAAAPARAVISQSIAKTYFPGANPIGQQIGTADGPHDIVGVVADVAVHAEGAMAPILYHSHRQFAGDRNWELTQVVATTGAPELRIASVRQVLRAIDPELVMYLPAPLVNVIGRGIASRVFVLRILTAFAIVALSLAALGLFGVLSYAVKLRTREFGIRMALGAERRTIRNLVMRRGMLVTAAGVSVGLAGAIALSRVMASMLFQVSPLDPRVLGGAIIFMALVGLTAAYVPAFRATNVDPRDALSGE